MPLRTMTKVLIANRGEIALRVIRAAKDEGLSTVAVYADPDHNAQFVRYADEAFALGGSTAAESYLDIAKVLSIAQKSGADAIHPGYGFLSENADFAQAVEDAGLIWIGPSPDAIRKLGDKVTARTIALAVDAPMTPGTPNPVQGVEEVQDFAAKHGLPIAIKAAFGGGGRGMKVAYTTEEIPELYESAVREATAAFGRGECFVERYLDRARHVECQVVGDKHGNIVVASTRDCSLQRRFQKLVEEAPAPFLTEEQNKRLYESAVAICREVGYYGAGTVEYLIGSDGLISFLEVNTRLQVEHPVTEEVTDWDLVREQFRIARGEKLSRLESPEIHGHAIEFRINGEDPGNNFMPAPGTVRTYEEPAGTGVRVDSGIRAGDIIGGQFDSMLAKLIVTGHTRQEAIERARRALSEYKVSGLPTVIPFHQAVLTDPAFTAEDGQFSVYTRWIEEEWDNPCEPWEDTGVYSLSEDSVILPPEVITVEVEGRRVEVSVPGNLLHKGSLQAAKKRRGGSSKQEITGDTVPSPMQGTVIKINVAPGDHVSEGDIVVVLEAMKMENAVKAHKDGVIGAIHVSAGSTIKKDEPLVEIEDV